MTISNRTTSVKKEKEMHFQTGFRGFLQGDVVEFAHISHFIVVKQQKAMWKHDNNNNNNNSTIQGDVKPASHLGFEQTYDMLGKLIEKPCAMQLCVSVCVRERTCLSCIKYRRCYMRNIHPFYQLMLVIIISIICKWVLVCVRESETHMTMQCNTAKMLCNKDGFMCRIVMFALISAGHGVKRLEITISRACVCINFCVLSYKSEGYYEKKNPYLFFLFVYLLLSAQHMSQMNISFALFLFIQKPHLVQSKSKLVCFPPQRESFQGCSCCKYKCTDLIIYQSHSRV